MKLSTLLQLIAAIYFGFALSAFLHCGADTWQFWATLLPVTILFLVAALFQEAEGEQKFKN